MACYLKAEAKEVTDDLISARDMVGMAEDHLDTLKERIESVEEQLESEDERGPE